MKKLMLIIGIILLAAAVLSLLLAALNWFGYSRTLDGSAELYAGMHRRMIAFFIVGIVLAAVGIVCLVIRARAAR